jgi:cytidyltransferase-like protein
MSTGSLLLSIEETDAASGGSSSVLLSTLAFAGCVLVLQIYDWRRRKFLKAELALANARLNYLMEKLETKKQPEKKEVRIFMDGAFDLLHFGHMNAFRLARSLGTSLIVGVNSDVSITECKGAPLMNDKERLTMVKACKFVDDVVEDCPYIMSAEYLQWVIQTYQIDYVVHGDDPCIVNGRDVYESAKESGKFRTIPRTQGVSTTDIVGRMLLLTKEHHYHNQDETSSRGDSSRQNISLGHQSKFLTTSQMLQLFSANVKAAGRDMRVIYIDGAWDMFHPGHVQTLQCARAVRWIFAEITYCSSRHICFSERRLPDSWNPRRCCGESRAWNESTTYESTRTRAQCFRMPLRQRRSH